MILYRCQEDGGDLIIVDDKVEQVEFVNPLILETKSENISLWIGARRNFSNREYKLKALKNY
jgi:hypothetical protein